MNAVADALPPGWKAMTVGSIMLDDLNRRIFIDRYGGRVEGTIRGIRGSVDGRGTATVIVDLHLVDGARVSLPLRRDDVVARYQGTDGPQTAAETDPLGGAS